MPIKLSKFMKESRATKYRKIFIINLKIIRFFFVSFVVFLEFENIYKSETTFNVNVLKSYGAATLLFFHDSFTKQNNFGKKSYVVMKNVSAIKTEMRLTFVCKIVC